jgi:hypothetical protein
VALPYPPEYQHEKADPKPLEYAATVTGGRHAKDVAALFDPKDKSIQYRQDLWPWVLLFGAVLLVIDTFLKRIRLFGYRAIPFH